MRQVRIFVDDQRLAPGAVTVGGQAARHVLRVLRMKPGQQLVLFDGSGGEFPATLTGCGRDRIELDVSPRTGISRESPLETRLAIAVPRRERMDLVIQKATELGASQILPLLSERSVVRLAGSRAERRRLHWLQVAASACEQSGRNQLPEVAAVQDFHDLMGELGALRPGELRLLPDPGAAQRLPAPQHDVAVVTMLIGPEGGFTEKEIGAAGEADFQRIGLGPRILRTETAAISLLGVAQWAWGDLRAPAAD